MFWQYKLTGAKTTACKATILMVYSSIPVLVHWQEFLYSFLLSLKTRYILQNTYNWNWLLIATCNKFSEIFPRMWFDLRILCVVVIHKMLGQINPFLDFHFTNFDQILNLKQNTQVLYQCIIFANCPHWINYHLAHL